MKTKIKNGMFISVVCASLLGFTIIGEAATVRNLVKNIYVSSFGSDSSKGTFVNGTRYSSVYDNGKAGFVPVSWLKNAGMTIQDLNSSKNKVTIDNSYIAKYNSVKTERDNLNKQVSSLNSQLNTYKTENAGLKNQLTQSQTAILNLTNTNRDLTNSLLSMTSQISQLQNSYNTLLVDRDDKLSQLNSLNNQVNQLTSKNEQLTNQNESLRSEVTSLQNRLKGGISDSLQSRIDEFLAKDNNYITNWNPTVSDNITMNGYASIYRYGNSLVFYGNPNVKIKIYDYNGNEIKEVQLNSNNRTTIDVHLDEMGLIIFNNSIYSSENGLLFNYN